MSGPDPAVTVAVADRLDAEASGLERDAAVKREAARSLRWRARAETALLTARSELAAANQAAVDAAGSRKRAREAATVAESMLRQHEDALAAETERWERRDPGMDAGAVNLARLPLAVAQANRDDAAAAARDARQRAEWTDSLLVVAEDAARAAKAAELSAVADLADPVAAARRRGEDALLALPAVREKTETVRAVGPNGWVGMLELPR